MPDTQDPAPRAGGQDERHDFSTTNWSVVLQAGSNDTPRAAAALELCQRYWYPPGRFFAEMAPDASAPLVSKE